MRCMEFGKENKEVVLLLHGGGLGWWNYRDVARLLQEKYHVVLPLLPGHAGSDNPFTTLADAAGEVIEYADRELGGQALCMGGLSLGAQVLTEALSQRPDLCRFALIESAATIPDSLTKAMIRPAFGMSYGLVRQKWFAKLQFRYLKMPPTLFDDYYQDTCAIRKEDMIRFLEESSGYAATESLGQVHARVCVVVGGKEGRRMIRSAQRLAKLLPDAELTILPGLYHGEFSMKHPEEYVQALTRLIG